MSRSYTSQSLIQLPILSAAEAAVLVTQILTAAAAEAKAAKNKELPPPIERSRTRLTVANVALNEVVARQIAGDTQAKRRADRRIDGAWSAGFDWLSGWWEANAGPRAVCDPRRMARRARGSRRGGDRQIWTKSFGNGTASQVWRRSASLGCRLSEQADPGRQRSADPSNGTLDSRTRAGLAWFSAGQWRSLDARGIVGLCASSSPVCPPSSPVFRLPSSCACALRVSTLTLDTS